MGHDWSEQGDGGMCVQLISLAHGTALDVFSHKLHNAQPPELGGNKLVGFNVPGMASGLIVMAMGEDGMVKGVIWGNIDMSFVGEDMVIVLPV